MLRENAGRLARSTRLPRKGEYSKLHPTGKTGVGFGLRRPDQLPTPDDLYELTLAAWGVGSPLRIQLGTMLAGPSLTYWDIE
jgi:hypothetical protein